MKRLLFVGYLIFAGVLGSQAAVLSGIEGAVFVNTGNGFQPALPGMILSPGDRVRTALGSVVIAYENGYSTLLGPNQITVILAVPPRQQDDRWPLGALAGPDWFNVAGIVAFDAGIAAGAISAGDHGPASP